MRDGLAGIFHFLPGADPLLSVFLFLLLFGFTLPIPEELALAGVGLALRGAGRNYLAGLAVAILALGLADLGYYSIARFIGPRLMRMHILRRLLGAGNIEKVEGFFERKGPRILFLCRFVVGLRAAAIMGAGLLRFPVGRFLARDLPALCVGAAAWLGAGFTLGARFGAGWLGTALSICGPAALAAAVLLVRRALAADPLFLSARGGAILGSIRAGIESPSKK